MAPAHQKQWVQSLGSIWDYTADTWGIEQADQYIDDIRAACSALAAGKRQGRPVTAREGYQQYQVGRHLLFYKVTDRSIAVIRILHQRMDVERHL